MAACNATAPTVQTSAPADLGMRLTYRASHARARSQRQVVPHRLKARPGHSWPLMRTSHPAEPGVHSSAGELRSRPPLARAWRIPGSRPPLPLPAGSQAPITQIRARPLHIAGRAIGAQLGGHSRTGCGAVAGTERDRTTDRAYDHIADYSPAQTQPISPPSTRRSSSSERMRHKAVSSPSRAHGSGGRRLDQANLRH